MEATSEGDRVRLTVSDDGRGVDLEEVVATAVAREILAPDEAEQLDQARALQSAVPARVLHQIPSHGRLGPGIGLDAVAGAVQALGGDLWIDSKLGLGTTVTVEVPVARRGEQVITLRIGQSVVALPAAPIRSYRRLDPTETLTENGRSFLLIDGERMPLRYLTDVAAEAAREPAVVVVGGLSGVMLAVVADGLIGSEEVLMADRSRRAWSAGRVRRHGCPRRRPAGPGSFRQRIALNDETARQPPTGLSHGKSIRVLLVDDSRVTREMIRRLLEDAGFAVTPSRDRPRRREICWRSPSSIV